MDKEEIIKIIGEPRDNEYYQNGMYYCKYCNGEKLTIIDDDMVCLPFCPKIQRTMCKCQLKNQVNRKRKYIPKKIREMVYQKYNGHCAYCGRKIEYKEMQVDHFIPFYNGGEDCFENYMPACRKCNFYKSTHSIEHFRKELLEIQERLKKTFIYKLALQYNLIEEKENKVKFYYEKEKENKKNETNNQEK